MSDNIVKFPKNEEECEEECEFCKTVDFVIDFVKEHQDDYEVCFEFMYDVLDEFYKNGSIDTFMIIRDNCDKVVSEMLVEVEGDYEN